MKTVKRALSVFIVLLMLLMMAVLPASASVNDHEGQCGANVFWKFDEDTGVLTIYGSGDMQNFSSGISNNNPQYNEFDEKIKSIVIEPGVTSIGDNSFVSFNQLTSVSIPDSVTRLGMQFLCGSYAIQELEIPQSVTTIEKCAFSMCGIKTVTLPDNITEIPNCAFAYCPSLESMTIGDNVEVIRMGAFNDCPKLTTIHIGKNVKTIEKSAFFLCPKLRNIYFDGTQQEWSQIEIDGSNYINMANVYCSDSPAPVIVAGDIDGDGELTILDATVIQKYLACIVNVSTYQYEISDIDSDGDVTILDATKIQRVLAMLDTL